MQLVMFITYIAIHIYAYVCNIITDQSIYTVGHYTRFPHLATIQYSEVCASTKLLVGNLIIPQA